MKKPSRSPFARLENRVPPPAMVMVLGALMIAVTAFTSGPALQPAVRYSLGSTGALAGPVAFALYTHCFQILPEERILHAKFGESYAAYCRTTRRWL